MFMTIKKICFAFILYTLSHTALAGLEGTWRFSPSFYSVTTNGFTQSWTMAQYTAQFGISADEFTREEQYSDSWLTPQTFTTNESGVFYSSTTTYSFSSDSVGTQVTEFTSRVSEPTTGQSYTSSGYIEYNLTKISSAGSSNGNSEITTITPTVADRINNVSVSSVQGNVVEFTTLGTTTLGNDVTDNSTIFTPANASLELDLGNNNSLTVAENTLVTLSPEVSVSSLTNNKTTSLLRGAVDYQISQGGTTEFQVNTPVISIKVLSGSNKRANEQTNFTAQYSQSGNNGSSTVRVTSGSVQVTDRNGVTKTVTAGQEQTFNDTVQRTTWVQPADSAFLFGGKTNTLAWMNYPGAVGYVIEYTFPSPSFAEENPSTMEFPEKKVVIVAANVQIVDDIAVTEMFIPASLNDSIVEARLFPVDAQGNILTNSEASDKGTFGFKAE